MSYIDVKNFETEAKKISQHFPRNKVTRKKISKIVLGNVISGNTIPNFLLSENLVTAENITILRQIYEEYGGKGTDSMKPKYLPFYKFIKNHISEFHWVTTENNNKHVIKYLQTPSVKYGTPSLLCLLLSIIENKNITQHKLREVYEFPDAFSNSILDNLESFLESNNLASISKQEWFNFSEVVKKGLNGEKVTIITVICPDYSYEKVGENFRYTFENVKSGIGLVASRAINLSKSMCDLLKKLDIAFEVIVYGGDFEALDNNAINKMNENFDSFTEKVKHSAWLTSLAIGENSSYKLFIDDENKKRKWIDLQKNAFQSMFYIFDYGSTQLDAVQINQILEKRKPLYTNWYGSNSNDFYLVKLLSQGSEYAAMGKIFQENHSNFIVLGADHELMKNFYKFYGDIPVIYTKRYY